MRPRTKDSNWLFCALLLAVSLALPSFGGVNRWTSNGPEGGIVTEIILDPSNALVLYAGTYGGGVFKSEDSGQTWKRASEGLSDPRVSSLAVHPDSPATLCAGTFSGRLFKTADGARHWTELSSPGSEPIRTIAFSSVPGTFYLGTSEGFFKTADDGQSWLTPDPQLKQLYVAVLATSPRQDLYAATGAGLFISTDGGETWKTSKNLPRVSYSALFIDPDTSAIYLGQANFVSRSIDGGRNWQLLPNLVGANLELIALSGGENRVYATTNQGVFQYRAGDSHWSQAGDASIQDVGAFARSTSRPSRLYVGASGKGIFTKLEDENHWVASNTGLNNAYVVDVAVVPSDPGVVYAGTDREVVKSGDGGQTWQIVQELSGGYRNLVEVNPSTPEVVYAANTNRVSKSIDGGETWTTIMPHYASALAAAPSDPATLYASLSEGMSKTSNGGITWSEIMSGIEFDYYFFYYGFSSTSIAADPSNSSTVFLGQPDAFYKTTNGGEKWSRVFDSPNIRAVVVAPSAPTIVYAALEKNGVVRSEDGGATWVSIGLSDEMVMSLAVDPADAWVIYAGTENGLVYQSKTGGAEWDRFDEGLSSAAVRALSIDGSGRHLFAATTSGVFGYQIRDPELRIERLPEDVERLPRLLDQLLESRRASASKGMASAGALSGFVIPVAGSTAGGRGTFFRTDLTLLNEQLGEQEVLVAWLAQGGGGDGTVPSFRVSLPASSEADRGVLTSTDFIDELGLSGIGSLVVIAVDASGNLDSSASIDGFARIWSRASFGRGSVSQSIPAVRPESFAAHLNAQAVGLRHDASFRTNVGIVNLGRVARAFTVTATGESRIEQLVLSVPPFSLFQVPIPAGDYGALTLSVRAESETALPWTFYGSSVNNESGDSWISLGIPAGND